MINLSKKIKELRLKNKFSQEFLAEKLQISRPTYTQIETGDRELTISEANLLAEIFGMNLNDFLFSNSKNPEIEVIFEKAEKIKKEEKKDELRISVPIENQEKFKKVLAYIIKKVGGKSNIGMTAIYKLLYFIDFDYYEKYEEQLMGAIYIKNHFGPTPIMFKKIIEQMKKNNEIEEVKSKFYNHEQTKFFLNPEYQIDLSGLSAQEIKHIDWELDRLSDKTASELSDLSHEDVPWKVAKMGEAVKYNGVFYRDEKLSVRDYEEL